MLFSENSLIVLSIIVAIVTGLAVHYRWLNTPKKQPNRKIVFALLFIAIFVSISMIFYP